MWVYAALVEKIMPGARALACADLRMLCAAALGIWTPKISVSHPRHVKKAFYAGQQFSAGKQRMKIMVGHYGGAACRHRKIFWPKHTCARWFIYYLHVLFPIPLSFRLRGKRVEYRLEGALPNSIRFYRMVHRLICDGQ